MRVSRRPFLVLSGLCFLFISNQGVFAQSASGDGCALAEPSLAAGRANLFTDQQEEWLGGAMADQEESRYNLLPESESGELDRMGQKLLAQLPATRMRYRFRVYDSGELNGLSRAGGYVYISRKLIMDARSEDEVAGVLAHEIGHIYTHQVATRISRLMSMRLDVKTLGDERDVLDKYQRMLNARSKYREDLDEKDEEKDEFRADAVGLYAMVRAGYAPQALAANLERIADRRGWKGNFLTDVLDATSLEAMRIRTAQKIANSAPEACRRRELKSSAEFRAFQQSLAAHPANILQEATPGLVSKPLDQPIRPGLNWVRFSPDGKYLLAQNETYIYVMRAKPLELLHTIYAPDAASAHFTADSKRLVFHFQSLRVEEWDMEGKTQIAAHEFVEYRGCSQSELSPDGKVLACVFRLRNEENFSLELFDVETGKVVFTRGNVFIGDERAQVYRIISRPDWDPEVLAIAFTPDSHYLMAAGESNNVAIDLTAMKTIKLGLGMGGIVQGRLTFTATDQLLYDCDAGQYGIFRKVESNVCLAEFPSGRPLGRFVEGWESLWPVSKGHYVVAGSLFDSHAHLVDLATGRATNLLKFQAADLHDTQLAGETGAGGVMIGDLNGGHAESLDLPAGPLQSARSVEFSADGKYLEVSNHSRGGLWDVLGNRRLMLTRSLRGAWFDGEDAYLQLAASQAKPGQNLHLDIRTRVSVDAGKYEYERRQLLDVSVEVIRHDPERSRLHDVEVQVFSQKTGSLLWSRRFAKDAPQVTQDEPGVVVFSFGMEKETAWDEIAHRAPVTSEDASSEKHQGLLAEMLESQTGTLLGQLIVPEGSRVRWSSNSRRYEAEVADDRRVDVFGELAAVRGNDENTVVYNWKTGKRLMACWGSVLAGDGKRGLLAVTNRAQEVAAYETGTGRELVRAMLDHVVLGARFVGEKRELLALSGTQRLYTIELAGKPGDKETDPSQGKD